MTTVNIDTTRLASTEVDLKQWINETLARSSTSGAGVPMDVHVGQLLTRLQLHQQETATSLEDMISQSVVRLPRVAMEVERMGKEARDLSERLSTTAKTAQEVVESAPPDAQKLRHLRRTKEKLTRCAKVLQKAKMLGLQLDELEAAASSRGAALGGGSHGTKDNSADQHDMETITTSVAEVHESLREVQAIDPSFGTAMEARLRTLEAELQHNVERDCLDLMRRQDTVRAPKLLAALRKIHRDEHVFQQYLAQVVQSRKSVLLQDLKSVTSNTAAGGDVSLAFGQHYRTFDKLFTKEADYVQALYGIVNDTSNSAVDAAQFEEAIKALTESLGSLSNETVAGILSTSSNEALVNCYASLLAEIGKANSPSSKILAHVCQRPYEGLLKQFTLREVRDISSGMHIDHRSSSATAGFRKGIEFVASSLQRCSLFFPNETLPSVASAVNEAVKQALKSMTNIEGSSQPASTSSSTILIQQAFQQYNESISALRSLSLLTDGNSGAFAIAGNKLPPLAPLLIQARDDILAFEKECRTCCLDAVCATMIVPFRGILKDYSRFHLWCALDTSAPGKVPQAVTRPLAAFHAGQVAPTDLIRQFGAQLMELPMTLESVESDLDTTDTADGGDVVQFWLTRVVSDIVSLTIDNLRGLTLHLSLPTHGSVGEEDAVPTVVPALEQLVCDLEYLSNVLAAVSEASFEQTLGVAIQKLQGELDLANDPASGRLGRPCALAQVL